MLKTCKLSAKYLDLIALPCVEANPLIVLGGIGDSLVLNPLNGGVLHEVTNLDHRQNGLIMLF